MTAPGGWPDAEWPGTPLTPERDGWHWLSGIPSEWGRLVKDGPRTWLVGDGSLNFTPRVVVECGHTYGGPCITSNQHAAAVQAAQVAMKAQIKALMIGPAVGASDGGTYILRSLTPAMIDALPIETGALDKALAEARAAEGQKVKERWQGEVARLAPWARKGGLPYPDIPESWPDPDKALAAEREKATRAAIHAVSNIEIYGAGECRGVMEAIKVLKALLQPAPAKAATGGET